jgi:hypothetical protein
MPIDPYIAGGVKLPQFNLPDYGADLAQFSQLQSARTQNELANYQLGAARRGEEENNQLRALFSRPDVDRSSPDFVRQIYAISPDKGQAYTKNLLEAQVKGATLEKTESDLLAADIERSSQALATAKSLPEYESIHNAIHGNPKSRLGKYFASIGFDKTKSDEMIAQAKNDPTGQTFLAMQAMSGLKGKELADYLRTQAEAAQVRPRPQVGAMPAPVLTGDALGTPVAGVSNAMVAQPTPATAPKTFAAQRLATVEKEIGDMQTVLASYPANPIAAKALERLVVERDKLVAQDLASQKFQQEKKTAVEYIKTLKGVLRVDKAGGTSELVLGPDGKPIMDVSAASEMDQQRHRQETERQGRANLSLEERRTRVSEENARIAKDPIIQQQLETARTLGRKTAENQATATAVLPKVISTGELAINAIDQMIGQRDDKGSLVKGQKVHPGFENAVGFGLPMQMVPGTEAANFKTLFDQVKGSAFLEAFEVLKGGGAISVVEGEKATAARNRMNLAQTEPEFVKAALEFKSVMQKGIANAKAKAGSSGGVVSSTPNVVDFGSLK